MVEAISRMTLHELHHIMYVLIYAPHLSCSLYDQEDISSSNSLIWSVFGLTRMLTVGFTQISANEQPESLLLNLS